MLLQFCKINPDAVFAGNALLESAQADIAAHTSDMNAAAPATLPRLNALRDSGLYNDSWAVETLSIPVQSVHWLW